MRTFKKSAILTLFTVYILSGPSPCLGAEQKKGAPQKVYHVLKSAGSVLGGIGLALLAHIATEYLVIHVHEYGHIIGNSLTGGYGGEIKIESEDNPFFGIFLPFKGESSCARSGNNVARLIGGPLGGIACTCGLVAGMAYLHSKLSEKPTHSISSFFKKPFTIYREIGNEIMKAIVQKSTRSLLDTFFMTFSLLKSGRMIGEAIYGFTPISLPGGDGGRLWQEFGVQRGVTIKPYTLLGLAVIPAIVAITLGATEGIKRSMSKKGDHL